MVLGMLAGGPCHGQTNTTQSPYSRYGLGELVPRGSIKSFSMGGLTQGLRDGHIINSSNPASYTRQDTMSFILDLGLIGGYQRFESEDTSKEFLTGAIHHVNMQFPVGRYLGMAVGFEPVSQMGYDITRYETRPEVLSEVGRIRYRHYGVGGLSQAFLGAAWAPLDQLSIGLNAGYIFGSVNRQQEMHVPNNALYAEADFDDRMVIKGVDLALGVQGTIPLGAPEARRELRLGATVQQAPWANVENRYEVTYRYINQQRYLASNELRREGSLRLPLRMNFGALYADRRWEMGADVALQDWSNFELLGVNQGMTKGYAAHLGMQYTPDRSSQRSYGARMRYRLGLHLEKRPIRPKDLAIYDMGLSAGLGFPYKYLGSMFHLGVRTGIIGTKDAGLAQGIYAHLLLGLSLNDIWFIRRRYQ
ncbi:MAG: hypothetical protein CSA07_01535 [Bacteroidia bacterium]|nr:MAG: hypothetical protein CSA07_01535 [Bacteroidia bacterium]